MAALAPTQACTASTFSTISLFGADTLSISANLVTNYDFAVPDGWRYSQPPVNVHNATFCNVTVTYTHPGQDDTIDAEIWLPPSDWNGILQSIGGGGWTAGRYYLSYAGMAGALHDGYATATTNAGVGNSPDPASWGLVSPGNMNLVAFDNFGQTSLNDLAILAKAVIRAYYGQDPRYSYWNGCSNGGRQASILAQQYPTAYNGIIAAAPAMQWVELAATSIWPAFYMDLTKQYPRKCEMTKLTAITVAECDALDGVNDGIISDPDECKTTFNLDDHLGTPFFCNETGTTMTITETAIDVARAILDGPRYSNGDFLWFGYELGTDLSALAATTCTGAESNTCIPVQRQSLQFWWKFFVLGDLAANITTLTHEQYDQLYLTLKKKLAPVAATEPRISAFQRAGGKMLTFHGLIDAAITPASTLHYFNEVFNILDNSTSFYRYYRVPGLQHCYGGPGGQPVQMFDQLRAWVENGTAPGASPVTVTLPGNGTMRQVVCPYPLKAVYQSFCAGASAAGAAGAEECWECQ
ncbi:Tannase/feruloyl esterase [Aspergillus karnatakaensis]|uniref:Tannase/feruloyl esterase n=1 Tax=Aspergillus karnatakaensis TaxID=1810916 RepID=UPI003CCDD478